MENSPQPAVEKVEHPPPTKKQLGLQIEPISSADYYSPKHSKYEHYVNGNEFLTIPKALDDVATRTISLLTTDKKTRKLMDETLKSLKIEPKMLTKWSNAMWDILLARRGGQTAGWFTNFQIVLQTEYMSTQMTSV